MGFVVMMTISFLYGRQCKHTFHITTNYAHTMFFHLQAPDNELIAPGRSLILDAPEPLHLSFSHSQRSTVKLSNGTNVSLFKYLNRPRLPSSKLPSKATQMMMIGLFMAAILATILDGSRRSLAQAIIQQRANM